MDTIQKEQDAQYQFPYHYIPEIDLGNFKHYKSWNTSLYYASSTLLIKDKLKNLGISRLVDIGCGDARLLHYLSQDSYFKYLGGFDYSAQAIALAKVFNREIPILVKDIYDTSTDEAVLAENPNGFTLIEVFEHIPLDQTAQFVDGIRRLMKKDDYLLLTVPHKNVQLNSKHYQHFTADTLSAYFSDGFDISEKIFLHKISPVERIIKKLLSNKLFVLNARPLRNWLYATYHKQYSTARLEQDAQRLFFVIRKT